jgi:orotate phosphoribosyltransferase
MQNKELISNYIAKNCLYIPKNLMLGKLPGTRYSGQYYMSKALYDKQFLSYVTEEFYNIIKKEIGNFDFQLAGREWSSIPLLVGMPLILKTNYNIDINSFMIKRERKTYGIHNYIEGTPNDLPVLIVDDVCNSTNSFKFCYDVLLSEEKYKILPYIFAVLNKYGKDSSETSFIEDRYLKARIKPLFIVSGDDVNAVR